MDKILDWIMANPLVVIIIVLVLFLILTYNNLNSKKKRVEKSFSTIDVYLEKRFDEIGSLLEQLERGYEQESEVNTQVSALRSGIATAKAGSINDKISLANNFSNMRGIAGLRAEEYPELHSILTMGMYTMEKTSEVEDDLAAARRQYNNNATSYNTAITSFPTNLVAGIFGLKKPFELFQVSEGKRERPTRAAIAQGKKEELQVQLEMEKMKLEMEKMKLQAELDKEAMIKKAAQMADDSNEKSQTNNVSNENNQTKE